MRRRKFIMGLAGTVTIWPLASRAQPPTGPVIGYLNMASPDLYAAMTLAFRDGLKEIGYTEGQNVAVEYRWADTHVDRLPALADELVRRQVAARGCQQNGGVPKPPLINRQQCRRWAQEHQIDRQGLFPEAANKTAACRSHR